MKCIATAIVIAGMAIPAFASDAPETLLEQARCGMCHQVDSPMLGPSYQAIAERYRDQEGAIEEIVTRMREGSQGIWGQAPMPPVTESALSDEQLQIVVDWIMKH